MPRRLAAATLLLSLAAVPGAVAWGAAAQDRDTGWNPPRIVPLAPGEVLPTPAELQARGARIGRILVRVYDIFDLRDPREDNWAYRSANALHYKTRNQTVRNQLTFRTGDRLDPQRLEESERLLRGRNYLYDAVVRVARYDPGANVADIEVSVRDVWTLNPGISYSNTGGNEKKSFEVEELNLFGRGQKLQAAWRKNVDRTTRQVDWSDPNLFGSRWRLDTSYADLSDGRTRYLNLDRPFFSLDSHWTAGGYAYDDERVETRYDLGRPVDAVDVHSRQFDLHYGFSRGLRDGWTRRFTAGLRSDEALFAPAPGETAPAALPGDRKFVYPYVGAEWVQDSWRKVTNHDQIGRTEDVYLGTHWLATLGYAGTGMGSSQDAVLFDGRLSSAREYQPDLQWSLDGSAHGRVQQGVLRDAIVQAQARHYWRIDRHQTFYASVTGTLTQKLDPDKQLVLGAEEGLRGYPLRYQTGTASTLVTLEQRLYTDWYPFRLFFVGAVAFFDTGRTWGPTLGGEPPAGWLSDAGLGLRFGNSRSGLGSVVHVDFSYALNAVPGRSRFQVTVQTSKGF